MPKMWRIFLIISAVIISGIFVESLQSTEMKVKTVRKGDTVSFMAIKEYGLYNEEIAYLLKNANPQIRDLNKIKVGQEIKFPALPAESSKPYCINTSASNAVVTYLEGSAYVWNSAENKWGELQTNEILLPGTRLKTGNKTLVELVVNNTDVMRLSSNTELTIEKLAENQGQPEATVSFSFGRIWTKIKSYVERSGKFRLDFPTAVASVQGTIYQAVLDADSSASIKVYRGQVKVSELADGQANHKLPRGQIAGPRQVQGPKEVSMGQWVRIVKEMQEISFGPGSPPGNPQEFTERWLGSWEKFNRERDARFEN